MQDMAAAKAGSLPYGAQRRLEIVRALATNPSLLLLDAAHAARQAEDEQREVAESQLSLALRAVLDEPEQVAALVAEPGGEEAVRDLTAAVRRVPMARRFHNDAVRAARAVREHRLVRYFRLAGKAPFPMAFEMDDAAPPALTPEGAPA